MAKAKGKPNTQHGTQLMFAAQAGDSDAFGELFSLYREPVHDFLVSRNGDHSDQELQDMVQEVFLRAWRRRQCFRGDSAGKTFLFGIAINVLREAHRVARRQPGLALDEVFNEPEASDILNEIDNLRDIRELTAAIQPVLANLSRYQREAFQLVVFEGQSITRAARLADCTPNAMQHRLTVARYELREGLSLCSVLKCPHNGPIPADCPAECGADSCLKLEVLSNIRKS